MRSARLLQAVRCGRLYIAGTQKSSLWKRAALCCACVVLCWTIGRPRSIPQQIKLKSTSLTLLEPQSRFWGQTSQIPSSLSPKRDCGSKGVNLSVRLSSIPTMPFRFDFTLPGILVVQTFTTQVFLELRPCETTCSG